MLRWLLLKISIDAELTCKFINTSLSGVPKAVTTRTGSRAVTVSPAASLRCKDVPPRDRLGLFLGIWAPVAPPLPPHQPQVHSGSLCSDQTQSEGHRLGGSWSDPPTRPVPAPCPVITVSLTVSPVRDLTSCDNCVTCKLLHPCAFSTLPPNSPSPQQTSSPSDTMASEDRVMDGSRCHTPRPHDDRVTANPHVLVPPFCSPRVSPP